MPNDYRKFHCRICGEPVFVPGEDAYGSESTGYFEMTCFNGHTDQYECARTSEAGPPPEPRVMARSAYATIG